MQVSMPKPASPEGSLAGPLSLVPQPSSLDLAAGITDLMAALKPRHSQAGGGASEDGSSAMSGEFCVGSHRTSEAVQAEGCCMCGRTQNILSAAWGCDPSALLFGCLVPALHGVHAVSSSATYRSYSKTHCDRHLCGKNTPDGLNNTRPGSAVLSQHCLNKPSSPLLCKAPLSLCMLQSTVQP